MRPTSLYAAPFSLPLLEGGNRVQVPRWAVQALLGPPATAEHGLQTQPPQQQALGETLPTTSAAGPGTPQPPQAQGRQDSDSCRGRCRPAPSVRPTSTPAPILRLPCLGEGQVGQDPVWWGTVQAERGGTRCSVAHSRVWPCCSGCWGTGRERGTVPAAAHGRGWPRAQPAPWSLCSSQAHRPCSCRQGWSGMSGSTASRGPTGC